MIIIIQYRLSYWATYQREFGSGPVDLEGNFVAEGWIPASVDRDAAAELQQRPEEQHLQPGHCLSPSPAVKPAKARSTCRTTARSPQQQKPGCGLGPPAAVRAALLNTDVNTARKHRK